MKTTSFENEFVIFFKKKDTPLKRFIHREFIRSKNKEYRKFFESFLSAYGIYAFNSYLYQFNLGYIPFINCEGNNVFGLKSGITDLSAKPVSLKESEVEIARFLINQFTIIPLEKFKKWLKG